MRSKVSYIREYNSVFSKMKITVLDGYTLNPGDLDWGAMAAFGDLTVYDLSLIHI